MRYIEIEVNGVISVLRDIVIRNDGKSRCGSPKREASNVIEVRGHGGRYDGGRPVVVWNMRHACWAGRFHAALKGRERVGTGTIRDRVR